MTTFIHTNDKPTALYRLFDASGQLLYVGISTTPEIRWRMHAAEKRWWPQVARKTVEWHGDREAALDAECVAIGSEDPLHNVVHHPKNWAEAMKRGRRTAMATYRRKRGARRFIPIAGVPTPEQQELITRIADMVRPLPRPQTEFRRI